LAKAVEDWAAEALDAVCPAQPLVQDGVVSVSQAQASIDAMEKGLP
jgi:hypothetical protein